MNLNEEILKAMQIMINRKLKNYKADRTYQTVVKEITPKGYVVIDRGGQDRTVQCSMPDVELKVAQRVYVKEPMGQLNGLHICGVVKKAVR